MDCRDILNRQLNKRFNTNFRISESVDTFEDDEWGGICMATRDFDLLVEFMYSFGIKYRITYFNPDSSWGYITLPKIKLCWENTSRYITLGKTLYVELPGKTVTDELFEPRMLDDRTKVTIRSNVPLKSSTRILVPATDMIFSIEKKSDSPDIKDLKCSLALEYYRVNLNKRGIYVNRKYRDTGNSIDFKEADLEDFVVVVPKEISITDIHGRKQVIK